MANNADSSPAPVNNPRMDCQGVTVCAAVKLCTNPTRASMPVSALGIRRDRRSIAAASTNVTTSGAKTTRACHVMGSSWLGAPPPGLRRGPHCSHAAVERVPASQHLGANRADDGNGRHHDQAGNQGVLENFAALLIFHEPDKKRF